MLDVFLEVAVGHSKQAEAQARTLELMDRLPTEELLKIASGEALPKQAWADGSCWLDQFKGTPLLDQAIALEKEELGIQMEENERRQAEKQLRDSFGGWDENMARRDELMIRRKLLELELAGAELNDVGGQEGEDVEGGEAPMGGAPAGLHPRFTEEGNRGKDPGAEVDDPRTDPSEADGTPFAALHEQAAKESPANFDPAKMQQGGPPQPPKPKPPVTKVTKETTEKPQEEKIDIKAAGDKMASVLQKAKGFKRGLELLSGSRAKALEEAAGKAGKATEQAAGVGRRFMANARAGRELRLGRLAKSESNKVTATRAAVGTAALGAGLAATGAHKGPKEKSAEDLAKAAGVDYEKAKEAFMGALQAGLKGIGQFGMAASKSVAGAARAGGASAAGNAALTAGRAGMMRAGNFIAQNPGAGAALVAAPAAAAGYMAGRQ